VPSGQTLAGGPALLELVASLTVPVPPTQEKLEEAAAQVQKAPFEHRKASDCASAGSSQSVGLEGQ